ncbi:MAG: TolC family protein [Dysgonamonadaceae bacterium]|jgi:cobalt-zinc-cadmium efflux system outer membrane protein|nr:TolC family protein [Dysgonamonadaceae bacterium]
MNKYLISWIFLYSIFPLFAQEQTLKLSLKQTEDLFLKQNLSLIAEQLNVDIADAAIVQAKLWDNPELTIGDVNLWKKGEEKQFSIELSQLIRTANKRQKLVSMEKVSKEMAIRELEETLRNLKVELRKSIYELKYLQMYRKTLDKPHQSLEQLINAYRKQTAQGNTSKNELLRLQSSLLELENEINEVQTGLNEQQKALKSLLNIDPLISIEIAQELPEAVSPDKLTLANLLEIAAEERSDIKYRQLEVKYHEKSLIYEKALRVPDITLSAGYDRLGGVWNDFIGLGISMELPVFNRNKGNIQASRLNIEKSKQLSQQQLKTIHYEVVASFDNYNQAYWFYEKISNNELLSELDNMLDVYSKNMLNKNINMLEYLDFMEAYKNNKQTVLLAVKNMQISFAELQYSVGQEIK